ncbi:MAG: flagellar export chaperone FlgN [Alkaliphilus sp.]
MRGEEYTQKLINISEQKLVLLNEFFELTMEQSIEVEKAGESIVKLGKLISKKQEVLDKISIIDADFANIYEAFKTELGVASLENYDAKDNEGLKKLRGITEEITIIMRKVKKVDDENVKRMGSHINRTKVELKNVKNGMKITKSYSKKNEEVQSIFIDKKS